MKRVLSILSDKVKVLGSHIVNNGPHCPLSKQA